MKQLIPPRRRIGQLLEFGKCHQRCGCGRQDALLVSIIRREPLSPWRSLVLQRFCHLVDHHHAGRSLRFDCASHCLRYRPQTRNVPLYDCRRSSGPPPFTELLIDPFARRWREYDILMRDAPERDVPNLSAWLSACTKAESRLALSPRSACKSNFDARGSPSSIVPLYVSTRLRSWNDANSARPSPL